MQSSTKRRLFIAVALAGAALGAVFAIAAFSLMTSRGLDLWLALPVALTAFFLGFVVVSWVVAGAAWILAGREDRR